MPFKVRVQTTLNHIRFGFYHDINFFFQKEGKLKMALHDTLMQAALSGLLSTMAN